MILENGLTPTEWLDAINDELTKIALINNVAFNLIDSSMLWGEILTVINENLDRLEFTSPVNGIRLRDAFLPIIHFNTYYISADGDDDNTGASVDFPWKTIDKLNATMDQLKDGDIVAFRKGDTFVGTIDITKSATDPSNPIIFTSYGEGELPIINGLVEVTEWTDMGDNIWESTSEVSTLDSCTAVVIDGVNTPMGRFPKGNTTLPSNPNISYDSWLYYNTWTARISVANDALDKAIADWTGGELVTKPVAFTFQNSPITGHEGTTLSYTPSTGYTASLLRCGIFIQKHLATLSEQNEWYYNPTTKKLSIYSITEPIDVKLVATETHLTINASNVVVEYLDFQGANLYGVFIGEQSNVTVKNCNFDYCYNAVYSTAGYSGSEFKILNNTIDHSNNNGIALIYKAVLVNGYDDSEISGNVISNTGMIEGGGGSTAWDYSAIQLHYALNCTINNNQSINSGRCGVMVIGGDYITIKQNFVNGFGFHLDDLGGIYTNMASTYKLITENIVLNGYGSLQGYNTFPDTLTYGYRHTFGIYVDDGNDSTNVHVTNNTVYNCSYSGLFWSKANYCEFTGNTAYANRIGIMNHNVYTKEAWYECTIRDNIVVSERSEIWPDNHYEGCLSFGDGSAVYSEGIDMDVNYYCRPKNEAGAIVIAASPFVHKTVDEWKTYSGLDLNSHASPVVLGADDTILFYYNETLVEKGISLDFPMIDAKGVEYTDQVVLQPFTSVVLMQIV